MKCPKCGKEFEPCGMCRAGDRHQYCISDKQCHDCIMREKHGEPVTEAPESSAPSGQAEATLLKLTCRELLETKYGKRNGSMMAMAMLLGLTVYAAMLTGAVALAILMAWEFAKRF